MIKHNAVLEVSLKNLAHNYNKLSSIANKSVCAATIKADAYGIGVIKAFETLYKNKAKGVYNIGSGKKTSITQLINIRSQLKGKTLVLGMSGGKFKNNVPNSVMDLLDEKITNLPDKLLTSARRIKDGELTGKSLTKKQIDDLKTIKTKQ